MEATNTFISVEAIAILHDESLKMFPLTAITFPFVRALPRGKPKAFTIVFVSPALIVPASSGVQPVPWLYKSSVTFE